MTRTRVLLAAATVVTAAAATAAWFRQSFVAITVDGMSMSPALYPGDRVLVRRGRRSLRRGRIVVVARPQPVTGWKDLPPAGPDLDRTHWYIKRIAAMPGEPYPPEVDMPGVVPNGHVVLLGDHPRSEDSKLHGACPLDQVLGVMTRRVAVTEPPSCPPPDAMYLDVPADAGDTER